MSICLTKKQRKPIEEITLNSQMIKILTKNWKFANTGNYDHLNYIFAFEVIGEDDNHRQIIMEH